MAAACRPLIVEGCSLKEIATRLNATGWTTFRVEYPSGFCVGGGEVSSQYVSGLMAVPELAWMRQLWGAALEKREQDYAAELLREAERKAAAAKASEDYKAAMKQCGKKRPHSPLTSGPQARALLARGLGISTKPARDALVGNPNAPNPAKRRRLAGGGKDDSDSDSSSDEDSTPQG